MGEGILYIDTKWQNKVKIVLEIGGKKITMTKTSHFWTAQTLLSLIDKILKKNKLTVFDISKICVEKGPGSFTGLRVGAAVANTLGYLLDIPINGKKGNIVEPIYEEVEK